MTTLAHQEEDWGPSIPWDITPSEHPGVPLPSPGIAPPIVAWRSNQIALLLADEWKQADPFRVSAWMLAKQRHPSVRRMRVNVSKDAPWAWLRDVIESEIDHLSLEGGGAKALERPPEKIAAWNRAVAEIDRLQDGWNGEGTVAPTPQAKEETAQLVRTLGPTGRLPEFEVDDSSGTVTISWSDNADRAFFALVVSGNGKVSIVARSKERRQILAKTIDLGDTQAIKAAFRLREIAELTAG